MALPSFKKGLRYPSLIPGYVVERVNRKINQPSEKYNTDGVDIFSEDWDNLIILDACRYDYFSKFIDIDGRLESRISRGSASEEYARGNFQGTNKLDTIYISHNSFPIKVKQELGDKYRKLYHFERIKDPYREKGHVRDYCKKLSDRALKIHQEHPNKRLVLHYIPPHRPYVNQSGDIVLDYKHTPIPELKREGVTKKDFIEAYQQSVQYILNHIQPVIDELNGKTVISADHGELLGDPMHPIPYPNYGHPEGIYSDHLIKIPWFIVEGSERREIIKGDKPLDSNEARSANQKEINEHLEYLGYKV